MWLVGFNKIAGAVLLLLLFSHLLVGQSGTSDWTPEMHEKYAILQDVSKTGRIREGEEALIWFVSNYPELHENIYILGIKLLRSEFSESEDDARKVELFQHIAQLYELRQIYFGRDELIGKRECLDLHSIGQEVATTKTDSIQLVLFDQLYRQFSTRLVSSHLVAYMHAVMRGYGDQLISEDSVLQHYSLISANLINLEQNDTTAKLKEHRQMVDNMLLKSIVISCEDIEHRFGDKLDGGDRAHYAQLILTLSMNYNCTDMELFVKALMVRFDSQPTYKIASFLAKKLEIKGEHERAEEYLLSAYQLADSRELKALSAMELAEFYTRRNNKVKSRDYIKKSLAPNPNNMSAYALWGDLYFSSFNECKKEKSRVSDRLVFLAAYEKYRLANDQEKMQTSVAQFPLGEDIHLENYDIGEEIHCGCWVNETVSIMKGPN